MAIGTANGVIGTAPSVTMAALQREFSDNMLFRLTEESGNVLLDYAERQIIKGAGK